ncbi:Olfactomedin-like domain [Pelomyxa schiedti]|nr:Olfactomedin-like domain [Pelomyxa schiedti]
MTRLSDLQVISVNQALTSQIEKLCADVVTPPNFDVRFECDSAATSSLGRLHCFAQLGFPNTATRLTLKELDRSMEPSVKRKGARAFVDQTTGKVYWNSDWGSESLSEFENVANFRENIDPRYFHYEMLGGPPAGTYQAVLNGHFYCNQRGTATIIKADVSDGAVVASADLSNAGSNSQSPWSWGEHTYIGCFADAGGVLWLLYSPPTEDNIHISLVDPDTLALRQTWVVPRANKQTMFAFVVWGRFYFGRHATEIDGVFDTATGEYDGSYRNTLPTPLTPERILLTSWLPASNQLLVVSSTFGEYQCFFFDNVAQPCDNIHQGQNGLATEPPCQSDVTQTTTTTGYRS